MEQSLKNRLTYGPLMLLALFGLLFLDSWLQTKTQIAGLGLLALLIIVLPIATLELESLFAAEQVSPQKLIAGLGAGLLVVHAFATQFEKFKPYATSSLAFLVVFIMLFAALRRAMKKETQEAIHLMAGTLLSAMYLGGLGWFIIALRVKDTAHLHGSTWIIVMILLCVKSTDIGAYFGGRALGKHKLIPWLSPGKTWEGLFCGMLTAGAVGAALSPMINADRDYSLPWWKGLIFGMIIGGIGQAGDLLESLMKRDANVKDSGQLVPGFGGILDIIDSPLLAAPFAYLLFSIF